MLLYVLVWFVITYIIWWSVLRWEFCRNEFFVWCILAWIGVMWPQDVEKYLCNCFVELLQVEIELIRNQHFFMLCGQKVQFFSFLLLNNKVVIPVQWTISPLTDLCLSLYSHEDVQNWQLKLILPTFFRT